MDRRITLGKLAFIQLVLDTAGKCVGPNCSQFLVKSSGGGMSRLVLELLGCLPLAQAFNQFGLDLILGKMCSIGVLESEDIHIS
ncbi:hypothetical protein Tco_0742665 [Tanacetum coccineum]